MLDIGFRDDIKTILGAITAQHQTIFVSATISDEIKRLARRYMRNAVDVNVSQDKVTVDEVDQSYVSVSSHDKYQVLRLLIQQEDPPICIVFTNTKAMARRITKRLHSIGINVEEIHGDLVQRKRERIMEQFRKHRIRVLVATDLASRGIDVSEISHIINYDIPPDPEVYVHRIGRTARMGARGTAITLVSPEQGKELTQIEMLINRQIPTRNVAGFKASPPRPTAESLEKPRPAPVSRFQAPVSSTTTISPDKLPPKTLGSRFRTSRRRRL